ncbi:MAG: site-2 protease family protein, partial [Planctomycetota bacterium]
MLESLTTIWNVMLILLGFGLVVFIHELGHFLAARWAGIRAPTFAIGFGPAVFSWRRCMGFRRGSSEAEYLELEKLSKEPPSASAAEIEEAAKAQEKLARTGVTEYRFNWLPLGGYVRMLGQEDGNPNATSSAPDSYTSKPVWKRMIVVSAGVIMNILLAGVLFMSVYFVGMGEPPAVVGNVAPDKPAAQAGLRTGDLVRSINGRETATFL